LLAAMLTLSVLVFAGTMRAATILGGSGNDTLRGTAGADKLYGKGGNDRLFGLAGNDLLVGGPGTDVLTGGRGADRLSCGPGRDTANADRKDRVAKDCESVKGIAKPPPPPQIPGRRIDVGGYGLYLECAGSGSPTVILEAGLGAPSATFTLPTIPAELAAGWRTLRAALASETRVCAYDRAGLGRSDRRPSGLAPSAATYSNELRTLLTNAGVPGPYVLYGGRFGGLLVLSHTLHWPTPSEIVGLVFSEALSPCPSACGYFFLPERAEFDGLAGVQLGDRPVVVLTSVLGDGPEFARRSTNSMWVSAPGASTYIVAEAAELVAEAVRVVVSAARTGAKLPPCELTPLPNVGGKCESLGRATRASQGKRFGAGPSGTRRPRVPRLRAMSA
jgi:pimeloyl-ACP methyl ester carboxylesterase